MTGRPLLAGALLLLSLGANAQIGDAYAQVVSATARPLLPRDGADTVAFRGSLKLIVGRGGKAMGRSEFMPPWGEELTDEQIGDVAAYLQSINNRNK